MGRYVKIFLATSQQSHFGLVGKVLIVVKNVTFMSQKGILSCIILSLSSKHLTGCILIIDSLYMLKLFPSRMIRALKQRGIILLIIVRRQVNDVYCLRATCPSQHEDNVTKRLQIISCYLLILMLMLIIVWSEGCNKYYSLINDSDEVYMF